MRPIVPVLLVLAAVQGCSWLSPDREDIVLPGHSKEGPITVGQLDKEIFDLADRYAMGMAEASDRLDRLSPDRSLHRTALMFKLRNATSTYDIVTSADGLEALLDLVTLIELQSVVWIDEGRLDKLPKHAGIDFFRSALAKSREEAWALAARALSKDQLKKVRKVIQDWRKQHPETQWVAFARFSAGSGTASFSLINEIRNELGGLIDIFGGTTRSVDQTRMVAERGLYFAKRMPMLLDWEAQAAAESIVETAQIGKLEQHIASISQTVAELPSKANGVIRTAVAGILVLMGVALGLGLAYRRLSLVWARKLTPEPARRPPTRMVTSS